MPDQATLQMIARLVDETSGPLKNISRAFADFKHGADPEKTTSQFKGLSGAIGSVGSQINQVAAPALASLGIRAGISAASIIGLTKVAADYARTVSDLRGSAQIMNMTTASTIQLDRAARATGIQGGAKAFEGMSTELLKLKDNIAGVHEEYNQLDPSGSLYAKLFPHALRNDTEGAIKEITKWIDDLQKKGEYARAEIAAQRFFPGATAKQVVETAKLRQETPLPGPDEIAQAEKLNETMQKFWTTWDRFYSQTMTKLIPGIDEMMKGMTAGFQKMPEYADRFLNSPAGKLLQKLLERPPEPDVTPEGGLKPPPEIDPKTGLDKLGRDQAARDAAGGLIPQAIRKAQEAVDVATTGEVKPRTATHDIYVPVEKIWQGETDKEERDRLLAQGADLSMPGYPVAPAPPPDWYDLLDPNKPAPKASPYEPTEDLTIPDIGNLLKPPPSKPKDTRDYSATGETPPAWWATPFRSAPPPVAEAPASGDDVKEGAKQGIIDGLIELYQREPKATDDALKKMSLTESTAADGSQKPIQRAVETFASAESKPELQQDSKAGDLGRRLQQSAIDLQQVSLRESPSDAMRQLQGRAFVDQRREDQALRDRLLQPPQLLPGVDQITAALANQKVEGSATLKVDIAAPPGTRTDLRVAGLFNETEINRRRAFQMEKTATNDGFELG